MNNLCPELMELTAEESRGQLDSLKAFLKEHHPENVLMPLRRKSKAPARSHKDGQWTWADAEDFFERPQLDYDVGILCQTIFTVDIDDKAVAAEWEDRWPCLQQCPKQATRKGYHYFFVRTPLCDEQAIYDGARGLKEPGASEPLPVDLKTVTTTGTRGVIAVAPSQNKHWIRPFGGPLPPVPDDFLMDLARLRNRKPAQVKREVEECAFAKQETVKRARGPMTDRQRLSGNDMFALLAVLKPSRWDDYGDWLRIGLALRGADPDNELGYRDAFEAMSERSSKWTPDCNNKWDQLPRISRVSLGTVHYMATTDNPAAYERYKVSTLRHHLAQLCRIGSLGQFHAAHCVISMHPGEFVAVDEHKRAFYCFGNHRWHSGGGVQAISNIISQELAPLVDERRAEAERQLEEAEAEDKKAAMGKFMRLTNLHCSMFYNRYKDGVVRELGLLLYDSDFMSRWDADPRLLGFDNGVLDVTTGELMDGRPEHMVSHTCGYDFTPVVDPPIRADVNAFLTSMFPTEAEKVYLTQSLAACLAGLNADEVFNLWTGSGANGKGCTAELMAQTLGEYAGTIDVSYFTTPTKSSATASPELAALQGKKCVFCSEPEKGQLLQGGKLKKASGRDDITARPLYGQQITFKPQFTIFMQANEPPVLNKVDGGTKRRIRLLDFPHKFVAYPLQDDERQIDTSFKHTKATDLQWRQQFMLMLLESQVASVQPPAAVAAATARYEEDCNPMSPWVAERVNFGPDKEVLKADWYGDYRQWAAASGQRYLGDKQASAALLELCGRTRGLTTRKSDGLIKYVGFALKPAVESSAF